MLAGQYDPRTDKKVHKKPKFGEPVVSKKSVSFHTFAVIVVTYRVHIAHIPGIHKSPGLKKRSLVAILGDIISHVHQYICKRFTLMFYHAV